MTEIHVVYRAGAEAVRQVVVRTLPEATVIGLHDPLNVGPLWDLDSDGVERAQFWAQFAPPETGLDLTNTTGGR